jgi:hypothetical protein
VSLDLVPNHGGSQNFGQPARRGNFWAGLAACSEAPEPSFVQARNFCSPNFGNVLDAVELLAHLLIVVAEFLVRTMDGKKSAEGQWQPSPSTSLAH